jgi:hypothetical protein
MGYAIIDVRYRDYEVSGESLKYIITKVDGDRDDFYPEMLKYYLGREVKDKNFYEIWSKILKHKLKMSDCLKRDVNIKVAAIDYIESNVI